MAILTWVTPAACRMAADQPQALPELRQALDILSQHVDDDISRARLGSRVKLDTSQAPSRAGGQARGGQVVRGRDRRLRPNVRWGT